MYTHRCRGHKAVSSWFSSLVASDGTESVSEANAEMHVVMASLSRLAHVRPLHDKQKTITAPAPTHKAGSGIDFKLPSGPIGWSSGGRHPGGDRAREGDKFGRGAGERAEAQKQPQAGQEGSTANDDVGTAADQRSQVGDKMPVALCHNPIALQPFNLTNVVARKARSESASASALAKEARQLQRNTTLAAAQCLLSPGSGSIQHVAATIGDNNKPSAQTSSRTNVSNSAGVGNGGGGTLAATAGDVRVEAGGGIEGSAVAVCSEVDSKSLKWQFKLDSILEHSTPNVGKSPELRRGRSTEKLRENVSAQDAVREDP